MRLKNRKPIFLLLILGISAVLSSFAPKFGGEGYQIFVNSKLVLESFGKDMNTVKTISLNEFPESSLLTVRYYHCGKIGKNRVVTIRDSRQQVLKEWRYDDATEAVSGMKCGVTEIARLQKGNSDLFLYYASSELPNGRLLAEINVHAPSARTRP